MKLFGCLKTNGSELQEEATIRKIQIVQQEGERELERSPLFYNFDAIIAVGYKGNGGSNDMFGHWYGSLEKTPLSFAQQI